MITTFVIPIIDTSSGNYDFNGTLSTEDYTSMIVDNFNKNYDSINNLMNYGVHDEYVETFKDKKIDNVEEKYIFSKTEAQISDMNYQEINVSYLHNITKLSKKDILRININPSSMEPEAMEEINYWIGDSKKVLDNINLDKRTMILSLPVRDFLIDDGETVFRLCDCKIMEITTKQNAPFSFALLVDKIIYY
jgi:hypothetical protein